MRDIIDSFRMADEIEFHLDDQSQMRMPGRWLLDERNIFWWRTLLGIAGAVPKLSPRST
jgi:hypothetical protein